MGSVTYTPKGMRYALTCVSCQEAVEVSQGVYEGAKTAGSFYFCIDCYPQHSHSWDKDSSWLQPTSVVEEEEPTWWV